MNPSHKRHPRDTWVDKIEIDTVERWKTSGMSGDEWRFSYRLRLFRKGTLLLEESYGSIQYAAARASLLAAEGFAPASESWPNPKIGDRYGDKTHCTQPGCPNTDNLERVYLRKEYERGTCTERQSEPYSRFRQFCETHRVRGDCACEDADSNYSPSVPEVEE